VTDRCDYVVVGQGLAGTTLAWHLRWKGFRVVVIDRGEAVTSSRVAAGLITPITGRRLAKSWRFDDLFPPAVDFYRRVEDETGEQFFTRRPVVRLFRNARERAVYYERANAEFRGLVSRTEPQLNGDWLAHPLGGFEMTATGQLATSRYLDASRELFARDGGYRAGDIHPDDELELTPDGVLLPRLELAARAMIFCQGMAAAGTGWFRSVRFRPAKGEILTLHVPGLSEERVLNRGVWLAPAGDGFYRAGSTYDRDNLDCTPTPAGREEVCSRLREFLRLPIEVVGHAAAVRPIVDDRKPVLGLHPAEGRIGFFNGLGSKGALLAPFFAAHFAGFLAGEHPLDPEVNLRHSSGQGQCRG
jgi:glycine/D-amino acid oxidase-like deaminating enzyme